MKRLLVWLKKFFDRRFVSSFVLQMSVSIALVGGFSLCAPFCRSEIDRQLKRESSSGGSTNDVFVGSATAGKGDFVFTTGSRTNNIPREGEFES